MATHHPSLIHACQIGDLQEVIRITESEVVLQMDQALICAASYGNIEIVDHFIKLGTDIHAWDEDVLRFAANFNQIETSIHLIELGADIDVAIEYSESEKETLKLLKIKEYNEPLTKGIHL
jgi:hypothetical protein